MTVWAARCILAGLVLMLITMFDPERPVRSLAAPLMAAAALATTAAPRRCEPGCPDRGLDTETARAMECIERRLTRRS